MTAARMDTLHGKLISHRGWDKKTPLSVLGGRGEGTAGSLVSQKEGKYLTNILNKA